MGLKVWSPGDPEVLDGELWMIQRVYLCPQVSKAADLLSATFQSADGSMRHAELNLQNDDAIVLLAPSLTDPGPFQSGPACVELNLLKSRHSSAFLPVLFKLWSIVCP